MNLMVLDREQAEASRVLLENLLFLIDRVLGDLVVVVLERHGVQVVGQVRSNHYFPCARSGKKRGKERRLGRFRGVFLYLSQCDRLGLACILFFRDVSTRHAFSQWSLLHRSPTFPSEWPPRLLTQSLHRTVLNVAAGVRLVRYDAGHSHRRSWLK